MTRRPLLLLALLAIPASARAQASPSAADSALIARILLAEDRRDSTAAALVQGVRHADERIRLIARRARWRITDPTFAARESLPAPAPPRAWPEPAWRLRYRALAGREVDCGAMRAGLADSAWPVRLRASDLVAPPCATDAAVVGTLRRWIADMSRDARRPAAGVSWHAGAHAIVALARLGDPDLAAQLPALSRHPRWEVRTYVARAAAQIGDTTLLRRMAADRHDNVKDVAITELARIAGHAADGAYIAALRATGPQAVRSAAVALKGSKHPRARAALEAAHARWSRRDSDTEHDVRIALLEALGRPTSEARPARRPVAVPRHAVGLALGRDVRLRVEMDRANGGGSFIVRLRGDVAPIMASRVLALANAGYYDGFVWQRVDHDFVIQGGGPGANEYTGYPRYFRDELGNVPHARGTIGMSTRGHDTGDGQWFFNLKDNLRLNPTFTVFAEVVEGIDVVDGIMEGDRIARIREVMPAARN